MMTKHGCFRIYGKVVCLETKKGIPNCIVEALDKDRRFDDRLGSVITDAEGKFDIRYSREDFQEFYDRKPDIYLRIRRMDGKEIYTTEKNIKYNAGKTEAFIIVIPQSMMEEDEMNSRQLQNYSIKGTVQLDELKEITGEVPLQAYAIRDRRVLGRSGIDEEGAFCIEYQYKALGEKQEPYGADLMIGPALPGDEILQSKLERMYIPSRAFQQGNPKYYYEIPKKIIPSKEFLDSMRFMWPGMKCSFKYTGFVYTCSPLEENSCYPPSSPLYNPFCLLPKCKDIESLSSSIAEVYVRISRLTDGSIIGEDIELNNSGQFEFVQTWYSYFCIYCFPSHVRFQVYQKTDSGDHILYDQEHWFHHDEAVMVFIDRDVVEIIEIPPEPTPAASKFFGFERIGNVPVEAVYKENEITGEWGAGVIVPADFVGYANSVNKPGVITGSADEKYKDYVFGGKMHLFANIGENYGKDVGGVTDMSEVDVKYFSIKYSYFNPETSESLGKTYYNEPFHNTRRDAGGTAKEFMGPIKDHPVTGVPLPQPVYKYANPYETDPNLDWKYRGLLLKLNTLALTPAGLSRIYGRYTFTVEVYDENLVKIDDVSTPEDCVLELVIDNDIDALQGEITNIQTGGVSTGVCGIIDLTGISAGINRSIQVDYNVTDNHGNLRNYTLVARYGKNLSIPFALTGNQYSRTGTTPYWSPGAGSSSKDTVWEKCAYEFRLRAWRRVTNGFTTIHKKTFTYHVYIDSNNDYTGPS